MLHLKNSSIQFTFLKYLIHLERKIKISRLLYYLIRTYYMSKDNPQFNWIYQNLLLIGNSWKLDYLADSNLYEFRIIHMWTTPCMKNIPSNIWFIAVYTIQRKKNMNRVKSKLFISCFERTSVYKCTDFNHNYSRMGQREELCHTCFLYLFEKQL
jgi:hypothetical protein